jgi:hypothetical protein
MKNIILILFVAISFCNLPAQTLQVNDGHVEYENEKVSTIQIITEPNVTTLKNKFGDWMDDNYGIGLDKKKLLFFNKKFMSAKGVTIKRISSRKIDLIFKIDENNPGKTQIDAFASFGYNNWITPENYPSEYYAFESMIFDFIRDYLPKHYENRIVETKEKLVNLKDKKEALNEEYAENQDDIDDLMQENSGLLEKIKQNSAKINSAKMRLLKRNKELDMVKQKVSNIK